MESIIYLMKQKNLVIHQREHIFESAEWDDHVYKATWWPQNDLELEKKIPKEKQD